jgi:hypothetical protein
VGSTLLQRKGAVGSAVYGKGRCVQRSFCGGADRQAECGELAAAVTGHDGELSGGNEVLEELLDVAAAEAGSLLEGGLIGDPLALLVAVDGDGEEDHEV